MLIETDKKIKRYVSYMIIKSMLAICVARIFSRKAFFNNRHEDRRDENHGNIGCQLT